MFMNIIIGDKMTERYEMVREAEQLGYILRDKQTKTLYRLDGVVSLLQSKDEFINELLDCIIIQNKILGELK